MHDIQGLCAKNQFYTRKKIKKHKNAEFYETNVTLRPKSKYNMSIEILEMETLHACRAIVKYELLTYIRNKLKCA